MGTHPIFESDFDCLTEMISRVSATLARRQLSTTGQRRGGFSYFITRSPKQRQRAMWGDIIGNFSLGFAIPCGLYLAANLINGVPEGPYYYDAETFQPEEWEYYENPLARLFYKYVVPSVSVSHWQTCAAYKYEDEILSKDRLISDVRRISAQIGSMGMSGAANQIVHNVGGKTDKSMHIHSHSPQLLNEMIEYADEHDIKRSRDMIVRKVITENGEGAWKNGVIVEFGQNNDACNTLKIPAVGLAPSPHIKPEYYADPETK